MKQRTPKDVIEAAIISGMSYQEFFEKHNDVIPSRWRDTLYFLRKEGRVPPFKSPAENLTELLQEDALRDVVEEVKEKSELKALKASNTKLKQALVDMYDVLDGIKDGFSKLPSIVIPKPAAPKQSINKSSIILPLYDLHIGHITNGPLGSSNHDLFVSRCNTLVEDLLREIKSLKQSRTLERLVIVFGGDIVEGRTIYQGQGIESAPIQYQLCTGPEIIARNLIAPLAKEFPKIDVFCLPGNHGRIGDKGEFDKTQDNLDMVFCHILKLRCENIKHMEWHDLESWFGFFNLYGFSFFAAHGEGFKSWNSTPFYGASKYKDKMQDILNQKIDVLIVGHHHTAAEFTKGCSKVCLMGNWIGTNDYSASMALGGLPSQRMIVADPDNPVLATFDFMIARKEAPIKVTPLELE